MLANQIPIRKKNNHDFRKVIFGIKKFFTENLVFFDFCKKIGQKIRFFFGNERYCSKEKNKPDFSTESVEIKQKLWPEKIVYRKRGKNRYLRNFRLIFSKLSEKVSLNVSRQCLKCRKIPSKI